MTMTEERHKALLEELDKQTDDVLSLAYIYAKGYELGGEDVTKRWENATLQTDALNRAYIKGYEDAMHKMSEERREKKNCGNHK